MKQFCTYVCDVLQNRDRGVVGKVSFDGNNLGVVCDQQHSDVAAVLFESGIYVAQILNFAVVSSLVHHFTFVAWPSARPFRISLDAAVQTTSCPVLFGTACTADDV